MPEKKTVKKAQEDLRAGKSASTAAGEFVHEEIEHVREGKHGARSAKQAIAIGLSKARRAGVPLPPPKRGQTSERTRESAERAFEVGQGERRPRATSARRGRAVKEALEREPKSAASKTALSRQAKSAARRRSKTGATGRTTSKKTTARRTASSKATARRTASSKATTRRTASSKKATTRRTASSKAGKRSPSRRSSAR